MKNVYQVLLFSCVFAASLLLSACGAADQDDWDSVKGGDAVINLFPRTPDIRNGVEQTWHELSVIEFGKEGGTATVKAYYPAEEKIALNDYYSEAWASTWGDNDFIPPFGLYQVTRKKIDQYSTEYTIVAGPNTTPYSLQYIIIIYDDSRISPSGKVITSTAHIVVNQAAE